ncbi:VanZ family protein [bacterium]|nr:VanZ family protein [bacterium]
MKLLKTRKFHLILAWILFLATLLLIINFSLDNGEISFSKSWHFVQLFKFLQRWIPVTTLHAIIRKWGHFTEYFLLGMSSFHLISFYTPKKQLRWISTLLIGLLISSTDESLQRFVTTNRSGSVLDVVLDLTGVGIGLLLLYNTRKKILK